MVKQPAMEASEFTMSNEDFPALPGLSGPAPGQSAPAAPVPSSMDDLSGAPGALPNQLGGQPQGVIGSTISSSDMILQSTQQGKKILDLKKKSGNHFTGTYLVVTTSRLKLTWVVILVQLQNEEVLKLTGKTPPKFTICQNSNLSHEGAVYLRNRT